MIIISRVAIAATACIAPFNPCPLLLLHSCLLPQIAYLSREIHRFWHFLIRSEKRGYTFFGKIKTELEFMKIEFLMKKWLNLSHFHVRT